MDTKWKKWKNRIGTLLLIIGLSSLVVGIALGVRQTNRSKDLYGQFTFGAQDDYQELDSFKYYVGDQLETLMTIANRTYMDWSNYESFVRNNGNRSVAEIKEEFINQAKEMSKEELTDFLYEYVCYYGDATTIAKEMQDMTVQEMADYLEEIGLLECYANDYQAYYGNTISEEMRDQMIQNFFKYEAKDMNVLYQITDNGKVLYTNMKSEYKNGDALPEEYNYVLWFDGTKVQITKDGKDVDVYGDGTYGRLSEYAVPGYRNYIADESLKNVTVTMMIAKNPIDYHIAASKDNNYYSGNMYNLSQSVIAQNRGWTPVFYFGFIGIVLTLLGIIMSIGGKEHRQNLANFQSKIWIELKVIVVVTIIMLTFSAAVSHSALGDYVTQSIDSNEYAYASSYEYAIENGYSITESLADDPYVWSDIANTIFGNPIRLLGLFWMLYLLIFDLIHNSKKEKHGIFISIAKDFSGKSMRLSFTKRELKRFSLLTIGTLVSFALLIYPIFMLKGKRLATAIILVVIALIVVIISYVLYRKALRNQAKDLEQLDNQIEQISLGNYQPEKMPFSGSDFVETEEHLLQVQSGMQTAVEQQLSSERMKVDLVANVSHDLKTPLTSIISYIGFLKEEENLPDHVKDYVKILDEKSKRLNEMVQDVFSISKATSGQLPVKLEILDFGKLLNQTLADMDETIARSNISVKSEIEEHKYYIEADGQRMYRVCQNLVQNALKYSFEGSRMFITLEQLSSNAVATFKNTSKAELNQDTDFAARFVRGDKSRTDGGSGLGLSIAKSFTEACGGSFQIQINGDMFIVKVAFTVQPAPVATPNEQ